MMWPFSHKKRPVSGEILEAQAAEQRAVDTIQQVSDRTGEVNIYYRNLNKRRKQNNFGPAFAAALERR